MAVLVPLSWVYAMLRRLHPLPWRLGWRRALALPVPVIVVGNLVVGGSGKTPVVMALVQALRARGWTPGVVSRGHGRRGRDAQPVRPHSPAEQVGDEPALIARRTGAPVWVGRDRSRAVQHLCRANPRVDVVLSDDGRQHQALHRDAELLVFGERGCGNGRLLPAGPLRESMPSALDPHTFVLYSGGSQSTALPGDVGQRRLGALVPLKAWHRGEGAAQAQPLSTWAGRRVHAVAGIAHPHAFFEQLRQQGLQVLAHPLPDHAPYETWKGPEGDEPVIVTEKDAVKIPSDHPQANRVWVAPLDFVLPEGLVEALSQRLSRARAPIAP